MHVLIIPSWYKNSQNQLEGIFFEEQAQLIQSIANDKIGLIYCHIWRASSKIKLSQKISTFFICNIQKISEGIPCVRSELFFMPLLPGKSLLGLGRYINFITNRLNAYQLRKRYVLLTKLYIKDMGIPNLVHIQSAKTAGPAGLHISRKYKIPYILTEHWSYLATPNLASLPKHLERVYKQSKQNYAVSTGFCNSLSLMSGTQFELLPNFIDTNFFTPGTVDKNRTTIIASIGNLVEIKNFELLIRAFSSLTLHKHRELELYIGGDGPDLSMLKALAKHFHIDEKIHFLGQLNRFQVRDLMRKSTMVVVPSIRETFGVVLIESLSCGTPVTAVRSWGPETIITSDKLGYLCENTASSLGSTISRMLCNIDTFNKEKLRKHVINHYSKDILGKRMRDEYSRHCQRYTIKTKDSQ